MSWEHRIAKELKKRDNKNYPVYFVGDVLSPVRSVDDAGEVSYSGTLTVSAFDGEVMLGADRLQQLAGQDRLYAGQVVALLGDLFSQTPGGQKILVLGVVTDAV